MQTFSIRDIENLSGIKAHTLRVWEQRYRLFMPARKDSKHREYTNEDLKQILRVSYLYHNGYKISRIARMTEEEITGLALNYGQHGSYEVFINQFIEAALDFDDARFEEVFHSLYRQVGFEKALIHVIYPYQQKIGMLWVTGNVLPAQEHFSSHIIRKKIILAIDGLPVPRNTKADKILLFAPEGEFHEIPLLLIHYFLKKNGYEVIYFGIDTKIDALKYYASYHQEFQLYFHLLTNFLDMDIHRYLNCLIKNFPGKRIFASGSVFDPHSNYPENVSILHSLKEIREFQFLGTT